MYSIYSKSLYINENKKKKRKKKIRENLFGLGDKIEFWGLC